VAMFDQPKPDQALINHQIKNGFYSTAYDIMKATGAKTSAAIFYILVRVMRNWDEVDPAYTQAWGKAKYIDARIHGLSFTLEDDGDLFYLNGVEICAWSLTDNADAKMASKVKAAMLKHLDDRSAQYEKLFEEYNKLPF